MSNPHSAQRQFPIHSQHSSRASLPGSPRGKPQAPTPQHETGYESRPSPPVIPADHVMVSQSVLQDLTAALHEMQAGIAANHRLVGDVSRQVTSLTASVDELKGLHRSAARVRQQLQVRPETATPAATEVPDKRRKRGGLGIFRLLSPKTKKSKSRPAVIRAVEAPPSRTPPVSPGLDAQDEWDEPVPEASPALPVSVRTPTPTPPGRVEDVMGREVETGEEGEADGEVEQEPQPEPETEPEAEPELEQEPDQEPVQEPEPEVEPESEQEPEPESEPEVAAEPQPDPVPTVDPTPTREPATEPELGLLPDLGGPDAAPDVFMPPQFSNAPDPDTPGLNGPRTRLPGLS